jgi:hypothetical protein
MSDDKKVQFSAFGVADSNRAASCSECNDTGVVETGNNDFPCDCPAGDTAKFVDSRGAVDGKTLKREYAAQRNAPLPDYLK